MAKLAKRKIILLSKILNVYTGIGVALTVIATLLFVTPVLPSIWYRLNTDATNEEVELLTNPASEVTDADGEEEPAEPEFPPIDPTLPGTNMLIIQSVGVNGEIHEGANAKATLEKGIWRAPDYGTPMDPYPTILAAHRFGYIYWSGEFRKTQSFFNLPQTNVGDTVEVIWGRRRFEYTIYRAEDSTQIKDYGADLILYTCRLFNSPVRVIRYAERTN